MRINHDLKSEPFSSNAIRLHICEWIVVLLILAAIFTALPQVWKKVESFNPDRDYRIPYQLSEDYWFFRQTGDFHSGKGKTLVIGDSVIWGQYVEKTQTLPFYLNAIADAAQFVNLGLDGSHPLALQGLITHYGRSLKDENIILHLNLLWLSSPEADLQTHKELRFNHPRLVPQFSPNIPCYKESTAVKIGIVFERYFPLFNWVRHIQIAYFNSLDIPRWTLENPYKNPINQVNLILPESQDNKYPDAEPWNAKRQFQEYLPWVGLETSRQWHAFKGLIEVLLERGNHLVIVVGPLNEHMVKPDSLDSFHRLLEGIRKWMTENGIPCYFPEPLPSSFYADLSHPLGEGYKILADKIHQFINNQ